MKISTYINALFGINLKYFLSGFLAAAVAIFFYYPKFFYFLLFVVYSLILIFGAVIGTIYVHYLLTNNPVKPSVSRSHKPLSELYEATKCSLFDPPNPIKNPSNLPIIFGKTVDLQLQQIIEYALRDFICSWLGTVVTKPKLLNDVLREDLWNAIQKLRERSIRIDAPKVIAVEMVNRVTVHLEKIRISEARSAETASPPVFSTNSYLVTEEKELEFLKKLCEIMIILLLPRGYSLSPLKVLLSEMLSYKIFFPMIKMLTSPDYINQKVVQQIEARLAAAAIHKRSYEYANTFEDFMKIIGNAGNIEELSIIRTSIVNDLMHATTMQNIQRAKGIDPEKETTEGSGVSKSDISAATRLKRYIQQLNYAKSQCEKNLIKMGWNENSSQTDDSFTLQEILSTPTGRRHLTIFLEPLKASSLVGFYFAVEELKHAPKAAWNQLGTEIFYTYIRVPKPEFSIDKGDRKRIETFLLGDSGVEVFFDIQKNVLTSLQDKYYPPFLLSKQFRLLKDELASDDYKDPTILMMPFTDRTDDEQTTSIQSESTVDLSTHSTYSRKKLEQIQERLDTKNQALEALKYSVKPESKVLSILEKEIEWLKSEKRQTEAHISRTNAWTDFLGKWRCTIQSIDVGGDDKDSLQIMILVHVNEDINAPKDAIATSNISSGWVVMRSLSQFHDLHRKLRPLCQELKNFDLPTNFKLFFLKNDKSSLEKAKGQIQKYLNYILEDDHLCGSEAIYTFLSPSSEHLKHVAPSPKKSKFSLSTLFKSDNDKKLELSRQDPFWGLGNIREDDDISTYLEGGCNDSDPKLHLDMDSKDSIAEPLYALMGEIFDMGGVFKWLRKSIISFVQISYGRTINRQIRESVSYLFEESMLHYYFSALLKSYWPGGVLASAYPVRSDDMKEMTTNAAKALLVDNIPEVFCNLVGAQTAKHGVLKIFNALQNPTYNKQLFYELLEILMVELFPEIRQLKVKGSTSVSGSGSGMNGK